MPSFDGGADLTTAVMRSNKSVRVDSQLVSFDFSVGAAREGAFTWIEGLSVKGRTAGGEEVARLLGGDGVAGESESEISSMSIQPAVSIG